MKSLLKKLVYSLFSSIDRGSREVLSFNGMTAFDLCD
jgi:hypothetical protein